MLRPRFCTDRRLLLMVPAVLASLMAGCGDDDDAESANTVTVDIDGSGPDATGDSRADDATDANADNVDDSGDDASPPSTHDIPSLAEVGRADFTHTIVAGDFLRKIADTYDVEIDDIVGANEWDVYGRDHMLYPGDVIYLPADAVMPEAPDTTTAAAATDTVRDFPDVENVVWPQEQDPQVCTDNSIQGEYAFQVGDTTESLAAAIGITPEQLLAETNHWTDLSDLRAGDTVPVCESWF